MSSPRGASVFFDPNGRRARAVRLIAFVTAAGFILLSLIYLSGLLVAPTMPLPWLETQIPSGSGAVDVASPPRRIDKPSFAARFRPLAPEAAKAKRYAMLWVGDAAGSGQLTSHAGMVDTIIADLLDLGWSGQEATINVSEYSHAFLRWKSRVADHVATYALLSQSLSAAQLATVVASEERRFRLASLLAGRLRQIGAAGLVLDSRSFTDASHANLVKLLYDIKRVLRNESLVVIAARDLPANRLRDLMRPADQILVNLFKEAADSAQPAPLAAQGWFEAQLERIVRLVDPAKLIIGIGAQAVEWDDAGRLRHMSIQAAWDLAREHAIKIELDPASLNPTFAYSGADGQRRTVWALDAVTAFNHTRAVLGSHVAGIAIDRMGLEDSGVWTSTGSGQLPEKSSLARLEVPDASPDPYQRIEFDLLRAEPGHAGKRALTYSDSLGLITAATLVDPPLHAQFSGLHATEAKSVALTFDDGPDPATTPKILDVLAEKNVKATFYIVGSNASRHPEIVARIYAEGHDIGNHSYSHRDMFKMGAQEIAVDLNGLQRLLEAQLGINSILFRAPYAMSHYREFIPAPQLMTAVSELGYLVGGVDIETYDYLPFRNADQIRQRVLDETLRAGRSVTVLMHDGGGPRKSTVEALGFIIDDLRSRGFNFVSTHELVGLKRHDLMPRRVTASVVEAASTQVRGQYMVTLATATNAIGKLAIAAAVLAIIRLLGIIVLAHVQWRREARRAGLTWSPPSMAVLVPGYNEEKVICNTVRSLLDSTVGRDLEIIVIDDGSTDRTTEVVQITFADCPNVKAFKKANGGKSAALNFGITKTNAEIIVAIDADTILEPDAIELLVRHFHDPKLGAVAGNAVVGNQINMITRMQALEYVTSQNLERRALEILNAIPVVPGAIGAWRRTALIEAGGYGHDTLAEDADLTIQLECLGWKTIYEPRARALTEAPEVLKAFLKQRFRWMFGTLQVAYKNLLRVHRLPLRIALVTIPNVFVFSFAFTLLAPIMDAILLLSIGDIIRGFISSGSLPDGDSLGRIATYWMIFQSVDVLVGFLGIRMDSDRANLKLLPWIVVQRFTYRQLLYWVAFRALLAAIKGQFVGWGKLIRTGTVALPNATASDLTSSHG